MTNWPRAFHSDDGKGRMVLALPAGGTYLSARPRRMWLFTARHVAATLQSVLNRPASEFDRQVSAALADPRIVGRRDLRQDSA